MKKNLNIKKAVFTVLSLAVVASAIATVIVVNSRTAVPDVPSTTESTAPASSTTTTAPYYNVPTIVENTTVPVPPQTTEDNSREVEFLTDNNWWYYFDVENRSCYAFRFKADMNMDIAYFDSNNVDDEDAKYFKGTSTYTIDGGKIILRYLPDALPIKHFTLEIKDNKLFTDGNKLAPHEDLSLDYPVGYFMVLDKMQ